MRYPEPARPFLWAALLALATALTACASASHAPPADASLAGSSYEFNGSVRGQRVDGVITFPVDGGYVLDSSIGSCRHTTPTDARRLEWAAAAGTLRLQCHQDLQLVLDVINGEVQGSATAYTYDVRYTNRPDGCADYDENGNCVRVRYVEVTVPITHEGMVEVHAR